MTVAKFYDPSEVEDYFKKKLAENPQTTFIFGLWIEGADWDVSRGLLVEQTGS